MKNLKSFILFTLLGTVAPVLIMSCVNRDEKDIIALKKLSTERAEKSIKQFEDEYFMTGDIEKNGSVIFDAQIKNFKNTFKENSDSKKPFNAASIENLIKNKVGLNFTFINDQKEKALFYSYGVKVGPGMSELPIFVMKFGNKNIEAASPFFKDSTFYIPSNGIGKFLALVSPKNFLSFFNMDFSYNEMKNMMTMQLDRHSKKRYLNAEKALYKKADIKKTDSGYEITFNNEQLKQIPSLIWYALKNDNRLKLMLSMYEDILTKEIMDSFSENISPEKMTLPEGFRITEEIIVKDGLISKDMFTIFVENRPVAKLSYEIEDYDYVLNNLIASIELFSDVDSSSHTITFTSRGESNENKADFMINMWLSANDSMSEDLILGALNYSILIDKTKQSDNFKASMNFAFPKMVPVYSEEGYDDDKMEIMQMFVSGSFNKKSADTVEFGIDKISLNSSKEMGGGSLDVELDSKMLITNKIIKKIDMPKDRVNVLEMSAEEWTKIKDEFMMKIEEMSKGYAK
ncbi:MULTISPECIES: hypothetical protein [unclassified Treponema]|uniref:hypothetical protein n=1 Tax=unclassified Treponema TaxID=2638727 RepID=UPI0020A4E802|nr:MULTISPECIES: hypothetical protein [unclassified Treponema]UTC67553.1 hypothetical protein E4O06_02445 [Treponema sp. OMZ 789]UTC70281.1 hypothetical protein E4O01_02435 [Treponema sp. OMZ 790]UTC72996.1 hypothetical protein E4O02_02435 [Treponema sp. OMZ 791]